MTPGHLLADRILEVVGLTRRRLPQPDRVVVRPNRHRLVSITRPRGRGVVLNVARSVVEAGEEAWRLLAPAMEGDRPARKRLRSLVTTSEQPGPLRPPRCDGTSGQRGWLMAKLAEIRAEPSHGALVPEGLDLTISRKMTRTLGSCSRRGGRYRITLSERLFRRGLEEVLEDTLRHEVAHAVHMATSPNGRSCHDRVWKEWAVRFGARPERLCSSAEALRIRLRARAPDLAADSRSREEQGILPL